MNKLGIKSQIFINECSLQSQFQSQDEFEMAVKVLMKLFTAIKQQENFSNKLYKTDIFIEYSAIKSDRFSASLNMLKDKSLKKAFINLIFNKLEPINWTNEQLHQTSDNYILLTTQININNTSIAEITERKLQNGDVAFLLINFINSNFNVCHNKYSLCQVITVSKNGQTQIELDCLDNKDSFEQWVQDKLDTRNFLERNPEQFQKIQEIFQGASIYIESKTHKYWYLDNLHKNHFEVFSKEGNHLGEANLNGEIDINKRDDKKKLKLS
jgi:hypothetical protein